MVGRVRADAGGKRRNAGRSCGPHLLKNEVGATRVAAKAGTAGAVA